MITKAKRFFFIGLPILLLAGATTLWLGTQSVTAKETTDASPKKAKTLYTCGMHPQIVLDHPGNCPICGMKLMPMKQSTLQSVDSSGSSTPNGKRKIKYWRAPMDPTYISDKPGKSPMGMDLIPVYEDEAEQSDASAISIDPVTIQDMNLRTGLVKQGPLRRVIRTVASIDYNETTLGDVTTKFPGWIEKLYVNATGELVMKGQPLFEIYSPELYSAEVEYLLSLQSATNDDAGSDSLQDSALTKLKFFDISDKQIAELRKTGKPLKTLPILAPQDGFVITKNVVEGQMVKAGAVIYRLADEGLVWVQAEIYEQDLPYVKLGQEATVSLSYLPDRVFRGRVTYIYPYLNEKTRTVKVRMEFHNPGYFLKPGMFASVQIHAELAKSAVLVPESAILRSGTKNTVFVALGGGKFDPRTVVLGPRAENDMYQVISGVKPGERIVTSGQFLLDSESQLREAIQKMIEPSKKKMTMPMPADTNAAPSSTVASTNSEGTVYVCPMPEHISIEYQHPGKCPICGMTLVPVTKAALEKIHPGGKVLYYTCPMPEHSDVHESHPGKCPKCGMTLIPVMSTPPLSDSAASVNETGTNSLPTLYTCPMPQHANVVSDKPGKCPKCGMDLVPTSTVDHGKIAEEHWREMHPSESGGSSSENHNHQ